MEKQKEYEICVTNTDFYRLDKNKIKVLNVLKGGSKSTKRNGGREDQDLLTSFCRPTLLFYYWKERMEGRKQQFVVAK